MGEDQEDYTPKMIDELSIAVIGLGGCGCNTVTRVQDSKLGVRTIAINTDKKHLDQQTHADTPLLIGGKLCRGQGSGGVPSIGMEAMQESLEEALQLIGRPDMAILTCGLGRGTGSGATPILTEALVDKGILTVVVTTLPFHTEGYQAIEIARESLTEIYGKADAVILQANDFLLQLIKGLGHDVPIQVAYPKIDQKVVGLIRSSTQLMTKSDYQNVDFADISNCFRDAGLSYVGEGEDPESIWKATVNALENQFLDVDVTGSRDAILHFSGKDIGVGEISDTLKRFSNEFSITSPKFGLRFVDLPVKRSIVMCSRVRSKIFEDFIGRTI